MRVGITTLGCDGGRSGLGQYTVHVLDEFSRLDSPEFVVFVHPGETAAFVPGGRPDVRPVSALFRRPILSIAWHQAVLPARARKHRLDVLFLPAANRRVPWRVPCPSVGTVHDWSSLHVSGKYDKARHIYVTRVLPRMIQGLTHIITVSESTKRDTVEYCRYPADRITVVPNGVDHDFYYPREPDACRAALPKGRGIRPPYILYLSRIEHPGKNHVRLIQAFERVKNRMKMPHQLVLAGRDWTRAEQVHEAAEKSPRRTDICFTGFVAKEELPHLYCAAEMVVFPSLYEGFGLPVAEAMACGVPVACSGTSSMPEVGGAAALYFDPLDSESIAHAIERLVTEEALRNTCRRNGIEQARQFTWHKTAQQTLAVIQRVCT